MTAGQREIALKNLDEQGVTRPTQYDDAGVEVTQLVQTEPDEMQKAAAAMAQRAPGKYFAVRLIVGAALVALSMYESMHVAKHTLGRTDDLAHLDKAEGVATVFAGAAYVVISWARYSDDGGALSLIAALSGVLLLALELLWKNSPLLLGPGIGEPTCQRSRFAICLGICCALCLLTCVRRTAWTNDAGLVVIVSCADLVSWCTAPAGIPPLKMEGTSLDDSSPRKGDSTDGHSPMSPV